MNGFIIFFSRLIPRADIIAILFLQPSYLGNVNDILILMSYSSSLYLYNMTGNPTYHNLFRNKKNSDLWIETSHTYHHMWRVDKLERLCLIFIIFFKVEITAVIRQHSDLINQNTVPGRNRNVLYSLLNLECIKGAVAFFFFLI